MGAETSPAGMSAPRPRSEAPSVVSSRQRPVNADGVSVWMNRSKSKVVVAAVARLAGRKDDGSPLGVEPRADAGSPPFFDTTAGPVIVDGLRSHD